MKRWIHLLGLLCGMAAYHAQGQNADSLLRTAHELATAKKYEASISLCRQLIAKEPENTEYKVLLGRIFSWQGAYDSARVVLRSCAEQEPNNEDALDALVDVELWSGQYMQAIQYCDRGLQQVNGKSEHFRLQKAKAQMQSGQLKDALATADELLAMDPGQPEALALREAIREMLMTNKVSVSYLNISYSNPGSEPWHFGFIEYKHDFKKCPLLARLNYGNVYSQDAYQLEVDAYPKLAKKTYLYLNAGYSPGPDVFPLSKAGAEIFQGIPKAFELSLGARFMQFKTENVMIYTGYLGKYYKNWWFAYRAYMVAPQKSTYFTHTATARRYFKNSEVYVSLNAIYGAAPFFTSFIQDITRVNAQRIGIDAQLKLGKTMYVRPLLMYEYEEFYPGQYHNRFDAQLTLSKKF